MYRQNKRRNRLTEVMLMKISTGVSRYSIVLSQA
jgi:hypothetical protein